MSITKYVKELGERLLQEMTQDSESLRKSMLILPDQTPQEIGPAFADFVGGVQKLCDTHWCPHTDLSNCDCGPAVAARTLGEYACILMDAVLRQVEMQRKRDEDFGKLCVYIRHQSEAYQGFASDMATTLEAAVAKLDRIGPRQAQVLETCIRDLIRSIDHMHIPLH